jgi:hypothetical protein
MRRSRHNQFTKPGSCGIPVSSPHAAGRGQHRMIRARQRLNKLLYKQHVDFVEYVLLLMMLIFGAVATGQALTHQINNELNQITSRF